MSWHYQARQRMVDGCVFFDVVERYTDPDGHTIESMQPCGESLEELQEDLQCMLKDIKRYPILKEDGVSIIILTQAEHDKFELYLEQHADSNKALIAQMETLYADGHPVRETVTKKMKAEMLACHVVAMMLRSTESMTVK